MYCDHTAMIVLDVLWSHSDDHPWCLVITQWWSSLMSCDHTVMIVSDVLWSHNDDRPWCLVITQRWSSLMSCHHTMMNTCTILIIQVFFDRPWSPVIHVRSLMSYYPDVLLSYSDDRLWCPVIIHVWSSVPSCQLSARYNTVCLPEVLWSYMYDLLAASWEPDIIPWLCMHPWGPMIIHVWSSGCQLRARYHNTVTLRASLRSCDHTVLVLVRSDLCGITIQSDSA